MSQAQNQADTRAPETIESEMEATRERLAGTIDALLYRASPKTIAKREVDSVRGHYIDVEGNPRTDNIVKTAAIVAGVVAVLVVLRKVAK